MKQLKQVLLSLPVLVVMLSLVVVPVASAHDEAAGTETHSSTETEDHTKTAAQLKMEHEAAEKLRARGQQILSELKKEHAATVARTKEVRQKTCEARKRGLQTRVNVIVKNAQNHQTRIDTVFDKAKAYQQTKNLTVANWDTLVSTATTAQTQAHTSVAALATIKPTVDCTSDTVAGDVANFKAAVTQTRTDLNAYRTAVKAILTALHAAKEGSAQ